MAAKEVVGAVLVAGGGVAGIQAALDLANGGYYVYLVESSLAIGGRMSQLDKTFPTNDCSACILSPKLVEVGRHINVELLTLTDILSIEGQEGNFTVKVRQNPRYIDMSKCIACGECTKKCPVKVDNAYNELLDKRKAIYVQYAQAVPLKYGIDPDKCIKLTKGKCGSCQKVCPADAVDYEQTAQETTLNVGAVVLAPGFKPFDPKGLETYRYSDYPEVITALEFERFLSATGPTMGHVVRRYDNEEPGKIAFLQCVGSRDLNRADNGYCSSVCCMYAIKQAIIAKEHATENLDVTIFYMDVRTFGKDFEKYYEKAKAKGIRFVRSRIHTVQPRPGGGVVCHYVTDGGVSTTEDFDMAVLSHGLVVTGSTKELSEKLEVDTDKYNFAKTSTFNPVALSRPGIYACGVFTGPKDIPASVMEASAAAAASSAKLSSARGTLTKSVEVPVPMDVSGEPPRVGVFICHCGINIGGVIDVPKVVEFAKTLPFVEYATDTIFACSQDSQEQLAKLIKENGLNRIVVSACSPRTHEPLFMETLAEAGLNKYLFEMANIRNHDSWVHSGNPTEATKKAFDMTEMAVAKAVLLSPLTENVINIDPQALVIGGGVAGMNTALTLAEQGFASVIVEKSDQLGGNALSLRHTAKDEDIPSYLANLREKIENNDKIRVIKNAEVKDVSGYVGNFETTLTNDELIKHGVTVIATGANELKPNEYLYGEHERVLTHLEFDRKLTAQDEAAQDAKTVVFIQCVGSREDGRMYCSKVCCTHTVHSAITLKKKNPDMRIYVLYRDLRTYAQKEDLYKEARHLGIIFIRYDRATKAKVTANPDLTVEINDAVSGFDLEIKPDFLVLAAAIVSGREQELAMKYKVPMDEDGWFFEAHQKLRPVDFATDGMFMAGICHYPKPMEETVAQAQAAAARALTVLTQPQMTVGGIVAEIDKNKCSACGLCATVCPFSAITMDEEKGHAVVNEAMCKGCGTCSATCRSDAPILRGFTNPGLFAQISAAL